MWWTPLSTPTCKSPAQTAKARGNRSTGGAGESLAPFVATAGALRVQRRRPQPRRVLRPCVCAMASDAAAPTRMGAANKENAPPGEPQAMGERDALFGTRVRKNFGTRFFWGTVVGRYNVAGCAFYKVSFDDGDVDVFAANEVMEDVKLARRHAKEDKLRPSTGADAAAPEAQTEYQAEMRRPTLKRKRDEPGDGEIRVRLWGQRLFASIYTSDDRQTFLKEFLRTEDGQIGELEASGLVEVGDRIVAVNGKASVGMASWEISDVIRKARRPLLLVFARGDGTVPAYNINAAPVPAQGQSAAQHGSSGAINQTTAPSTASQSAPAAQEPSARLTSGQETSRTGGSGAGSAHARAVPLHAYAPSSNDQSLSSSQYPRQPTAPSPPVTAPGAQLGPASAAVISGRTVEVHGAGASNVAQHYPHHPPNAPAQHSTQFHTDPISTSNHLAAVAATNSKMLQLREALLERQREQLSRHELMQQQLHRMGPNLPTNGLTTTLTRQPVPANHPVTSGHSGGAGQWTSRPQGRSTALVPAPPNNYGAVPMARAQPMMGVPMAIPPPVVNSSWVPTQQQQQQGWGYAPIQIPYPTIPSNPASSSRHPIPSQATRPRFEVVDGTGSAPPPSRSSTPSLPQVSPPPAGPSLHPLSGVQASESSASTPLTSPTKEVAALSPAALQNGSEIDIDEDAAAIAALAGESPSKEPSSASDEPTSFLSLTAASADASTASEDAPLVEGANYFVVMIRKPRLYVTLGTLGSHVAVTSFVRDESGEKGEIEESGRVYVGDVIVGVNGVRLGPSMSPSMLAHMVNTTPRPMSIWFERASWDTLVGSN